MAGCSKECDNCAMRAEVTAVKQNQEKWDGRMWAIASSILLAVLSSATAIFLHFATARPSEAAIAQAVVSAIKQAK